MESQDQIDGLGPFRCIPKLILCAISGALTGSFAVAGAFTGAIAGALAGRASDSGFFRGAVLGAVAGAVLSIEMLEASRAYWLLEQTGSRGTSAMADFIEELLHGRFIDEQFTRSMIAAHQWQRVTIAAGDYEEVNNVQDLVASRGLSGDTLDKLQHHVIVKATNTEHNLFCTICLQDMEIGEIARSLPQCRHTFHLTCVDKWLLGHGSCPVCRRDV